MCERCCSEKGQVHKMKKKWKGVFLFCGVLAVVGAGMCIAGLSMGFSRNDMPDWIFPHVGWIHSTEVLSYENTGEKYSECFTGIRNLDLQAEVLEVEVRKGDIPSGEVEIETYDKEVKDGMTVYKRGDTLVVRNESEGVLNMGNSKTAKLTIFISEEGSFGKVKGEAGAGSLWFEELRCDQVELDVGAGSILADTFTAREIDIKCQAGSVELQDGNNPESVQVSCSAGAVEMMLAGDREQYRYDVETNLGSISVDGEDIVSGLHEMDHSGQETGKKIQAECKAGSIEIMFQ